MLSIAYLGATTSGSFNGVRLRRGHIFKLEQKHAFEFLKVEDE
jgi:hypothetical protein